MSGYVKTWKKSTIPSAWCRETITIIENVLYGNLDIDVNIYVFRPYDCTIQTTILIKYYYYSVFMHQLMLEPIAKFRCACNDERLWRRQTALSESKWHEEIKWTWKKGIVISYHSQVIAVDRPNNGSHFIFPHLLLH